MLLVNIWSLNSKVCVVHYIWQNWLATKIMYFILFYFLFCWAFMFFILFLFCFHILSDSYSIVVLITGSAKVNAWVMAVKWNRWRNTVPTKAFPCAVHLAAMISVEMQKCMQKSLSFGCLLTSPKSHYSSVLLVFYFSST